MMMCSTISVAGVTATRSKRCVGKQRLTIPVFSRGAETEHIPINQIRIVWDSACNLDHLKSLCYAYSKTPHFETYLPLLDEFYNRRDEFLADFTIEFTIALAWVGRQ